MRCVFVELAALGNTPWIPVDSLQNTFGIGIGVMPSSNGNLTYTVHHTFDDLGSTGRRLVSISRAAAVATVIDPNHGLSVGDSLIVTGTGSAAVLDSQPGAALAPQQVQGGQPVPWDVASVVDQNTYTYACANSGPTSDLGQSYVNSQRVFPHSTLVAATARLDGNYGFPVRGVRLKVTIYTAGFVVMAVMQPSGR